jgi:hypothetical protein
MCYREFVIATRKELSEQYLESVLEHKYGNTVSFPIKEAVKIIFDRVYDEIIRGFEDFEQQYELFRDTYGMKEIFKKVDEGHYTFFYFGGIARSHSWLWDIEIIDKDFLFCVSRYET